MMHVVRSNNFTGGVRTLMLTQRSKEGGHNRPDYKAVKRVVRNHDEYLDVYDELFRMKEAAGVPMRIYASVNRRNVEKAIRRFKFKQLEADFYDDGMRHAFYYDIKNRWFGSLMEPQSRAETYFLVDVDKEEERTIEDVMFELQQYTEIMFFYATPNGTHFITKPFNPNKTPDLEIKKDGLLLLSS